MVSSVQLMQGQVTPLQASENDSVLLVIIEDISALILGQILNHHSQLLDRTGCVLQIGQQLVVDIRHLQPHAASACSAVQLSAASNILRMHSLKTDWGGLEHHKSIQHRPVKVKGADLHIQYF